MDTVDQLIGDARRAGLELSVVGDQLKVSGPRSGVDLVDRIRTMKPAVIARLTGPTSFFELLDHLDADDRFALEERAAIIEEGSKCSRAESERKAFDDWLEARGN
jgi:hypothetical protein